MAQPPVSTRFQFAFDVRHQLLIAGLMCRAGSVTTGDHKQCKDRAVTTVSAFNEPGVR